LYFIGREEDRHCYFERNSCQQGTFSTSDDHSRLIPQFRHSYQGKLLLYYFKYWLKAIYQLVLVPDPIKLLPTTVPTDARC
jgi:hypothetical protein